MARLTLSFKDRKLKVFGLQAGDCMIGRDSDCAIRIDSLAVEPRHARIRSVEKGFVLEVLDGAQVLVNGQNVHAAHELRDGDSLQIGKHTFCFSEEGDLVGAETVVSHSGFPRSAWLQIHSGSHLGRTIRLNKAFTRIGKPDGSLAVIARREDGYYLSHLQGDSSPQVNDRDIEAHSIRLINNDFITVGELRVQFFADGGDGLLGTLSATSEQRRSARAVLEVPATLRADGQDWPVELLDMSLHGALVRPPAAFQPRPEEAYELSIKSEDGADIVMAVQIAQQREDQLGLRCVDIDPDSVAQLRRLVELNLGEARMLEREISALG
jgi:pSer/pThr/pTyr-binding forkhead associated (FHA) protein